MGLKINGEYLPDSFIEEEYQHVRASYLQRAPHLIPLREQLLVLVKENLVRRVLLRQAASKAKFHIPPAVLAEEVRQLKAQLSSKASSASKTTPIQDKELEAHVELQLKIAQLCSTAAQDITAPNEEQVELFYQDNKKVYEKEEAVFLFEASATYKNSAELQRLKQAWHKIAVAFEKGKAQFLPPKELVTIGWRLAAQLPEKALAHALSKQKKQLSYYALPLHHSKGVLQLLCVKEHRKVSELPPAALRACVKVELLKELRERKIDMYVYKLMKQSEVIDEVML